MDDCLYGCRPGTADRIKDILEEECILVKDKTRPEVFMRRRLLRGAGPESEIEEVKCCLYRAVYRQFSREGAGVGTYEE